jgi:hypothetical protein
MDDNDRADFAASLLAVISALEKKGLITVEEIREAAIERFLTLSPDGSEADEYPLLHSMATELPSRPDE